MKNTFLIISICLNFYLMFLISKKKTIVEPEKDFLTIKDSINDNYKKSKESIKIRVDSMDNDSAYFRLIEFIEQRMQNVGTVNRHD